MRIWKGKVADIVLVQELCHRANQDVPGAKLQLALAEGEDSLLGLYLIAEDGAPLMGVLVEPWQQNIALSRVVVTFGEDDSDFRHYLKQFFALFLRRYNERKDKPLFWLTESERVKDVALEIGFEIYREVLKLRKDDFATPAAAGLPVQIRPFQPEDLEGLMVIEQAVFMPEVWNTREMFKKLAQNERGKLYLAIFMEQVVGYNYNYINEQGEGVINRLGIHEDYHGLGIGKQMMVNAVEWFKAQNVSSITLLVRRENLSARILYEKFGFSEYGLEYRLRYSEGGV